MDYSFDITLKNRQLLAGIIDKFSLEQLNTIPTGFNNNIIWNIGHSIVTQQLLVYGLSGNEIKVSQEMKNAYCKGSKPSNPLSQQEVDHIKELLFTTLDQLKEDYKTGVFKEFKEYTLSTTGGTLSKVEDAIEFNNFHEGLHLGYCIAQARVIQP